MLKIKHIFYLFIVFVALNSCKVSQGERIVRAHDRLRSISDQKLYDTIVSNYINYETINIKRLNFTFTQEGKSHNFKGSLRIKKDSIIWLSISKMGIEGMRIKLTPDSVAFIDRLQKKYLKTDYSFFNKKFRIKLDYYIIQALLTNQLPEYGVVENRKFTRNFKSRRDKKHYVFFSKRGGRSYWKGKERKQTAPVEIIRISPDIMRLESIDIYDSHSYEGIKQLIHLNLEYQNYKKIDNHIFPETLQSSITINESEEEIRKAEDSKKILLKITINRISVNEHLSFPFSVSNKYKRVDE